MSFRSSVPVRLGDQHQDPGSIPGSSTEGAAEMRPCRKDELGDLADSWKPSTDMTAEELCQRAADGASADG